MNSKIVLASAVLVSLASVSVFAQYTPGTGAPYAPGAPMVPAPMVPAAPAAATPQGAYSWQVQGAAPAPAAAPAVPVQSIQPIPAAAAPDVSAPTTVVVQAPAQVVVPQLSPEQLNDLTGSIALYPDPLVAEMLPAATYVQEITYADKWLAQHPGVDDATIAGLPVHPSVQALMHYPTVLSMLADHIDWTQALGVAFQFQPNDVMDAIQRWRLTAVTYGTLASSPQLEVLRQGNMIMIVPPPNVQVLYVPVYDPAVVFVRPMRPIRDAITFGAGGFSLTFVHNDVDWGRHEVHVPVVVDVHGHVGPAEKHVFVHDDLKPAIAYPDKIVTPADHRVVTLPAHNVVHGDHDTLHGDHETVHVDTDRGGRGGGRSDLAPVAPGGAATPPNGPGRGRNNNNPPGTPF